MQKENPPGPSNDQQFVGPFRLDKTLGKGQTGKFDQFNNSVTSAVGGCSMFGTGNFTYFIFSFPSKIVQ